MRCNWAIWTVPTLLAVMLYWPSLHYPFLSFDDWWIVHNPDFRNWWSLEGLWSTFFGFSKEVRMKHGAEYLPIRDLWAATQFTLFQDHVFPYRILQIVLYGFSTSLFLHLVRWFGASKSLQWMTALLFLLHPIHVEPVVWLSSQKDLLCLVYFVGMLLAYARGHTKIAWFLFLLGLGSKYQMVTAPLLLPLIDSYRRGISKKWKIYLFFGSTAVIAAIVFTFVGEVVRYGHGNLGSSVEVIAANSLALFHGSIMNLIFPIDLQVLYPFQRVLSGADVRIWIGLFFLIAATSIMFLHKRYPRPAFGSALILAGIIPMFRAPEMHWMADRYLLISSLGIALLTAEFVTHVSIRRLQFVFLTLFLISYAAYTRAYITVWKSDLALWTHAEEGGKPVQSKVKQNLTDQLMLSGASELKANQLKEAARHFRYAVDLTPSSPAARLNLGITLAQLGEFEEAKLNLVEATKLSPQDADVRFNLALLYVQIGDRNALVKEVDILRKLAPEDSRLKKLERLLRNSQ
jgi:protein O-mannosyl-transferase